MSNLSKLKREQMLDFLAKLRDSKKDDEVDDKKDENEDDSLTDQHIIGVYGPQEDYE